jgi:hypothetical protein
MTTRDGKNPALEMAGVVTASDTVRLICAETPEEKLVTIHVKDGMMMLDDATWIQTSIHCSSGYIQGIDTMLHAHQLPWNATEEFVLLYPGLKRSTYPKTCNQE